MESAKYAFYTYEIQESPHLEFPHENKAPLDIINEIIKMGMHLTCKKKKDESYHIDVHKLIKVGRVYLIELLDTKETKLFDGHKTRTEKSHPGVYVIFDNRDNVCQIAIEVNKAFDGNTDKVVKSLKRTIDATLNNHSLKIVIKRKYQAFTIKDRVNERLLNGDSIRKVAWEFPNPRKVSGIDNGPDSNELLDYMCRLTQASNALKSTLTLYGTKGDPMTLDDDTNVGLSNIIALSAQNNYNLAFHFHISKEVIRLRDAEAAFFEIEQRVIDDFMNGQQGTDDLTSANKYELTNRLDTIRREIASYKNEKTVDER